LTSCSECLYQGQVLEEEPLPEFGVGVIVLREAPPRVETSVSTEGACPEWCSCWVQAPSEHHRGLEVEDEATVLGHRALEHESS